jgi:hypothetical protein
MCNCKSSGKPQVLTNENSKDHVELIKTTFKDMFETQTIDDLNEGDKMVLVQLFHSVYPRAKYTPDTKGIVNELNQVVVNYETRRR